MDSSHYALWLMPSGTVYARLTQLIRELAHEFSAPFFDPHVTLLGGITGETAKIVRQCEQLAASLRPFEIHLSEPGHLDDYYRSLFIRVARSPALLQANKRAREVFSCSGHPKYLPHVSLLYGIHPSEHKERIITKKLGKMNLKFSVAHLFLIDLAGGPKKWTRIRNFPFRRERRQR